MAYIDTMVAAVPTANKNKYLEHTKKAADVFKECGVQTYVECWGDDVPHGQVTDFYGAVQAKEDETVVVAFMTWPDKATRDAGMAKAMEDPRMRGMQMPFDGRRMIYGGFSVILER